MKLSDAQNMDLFSDKGYKIIDSDVETKLLYGKHYDKNPQVTIVVPTYKRDTLLERALQSALNQKGYDDYQILVIDNDGESELSLAETVVRRINSEKIVYYKNTRNTGTNFHRGVERTRSKWVCFLHDDDVLCEFFLREMMRVLQKNTNIECLTCGSSAFGSNGKQHPEYTYEKDSLRRVLFTDFLFGQAAPLLGAIMDRESFLKIDTFPSNEGVEQWYLGATWDQCFMAKYAYLYKMYAVDKVLYGYFRHAENDGVIHAKEYATICGTELFLLRKAIIKHGCILLRPHRIMANKYCSLKHLDEQWVRDSGADMEPYQKFCGIKKQHMVYYWCYIIEKIIGRIKRSIIR